MIRKAPLAVYRQTSLRRRVSHPRFGRVLKAAGATLAVLAATASAAPTECRYANLVRSIDVVYSEPGQPVPCEVLYTKTGESTTTPWRAQHEAGYCEARAEWLIDHLKSDGWECMPAADEPGPGDAARTPNSGDTDTPV